MNIYSTDNEQSSFDGLMASDRKETLKVDNHANPVPETHIVNESTMEATANEVRLHKTDQSSIDEFKTIPELDVSVIDTSYRHPPPRQMPKHGEIVNSMFNNKISHDRIENNKAGRVTSESNEEKNATNKSK
eukprot:CFRG1758T1